MQNRYDQRGLLIAAVALCVMAGMVFAETKTVQRPDYFAIVKNYADAMIKDGRDVYGKRHTPLFAAALNRKTMKIGRFGRIAGIRKSDRSLKGANPMHDQNLYQILYALTTITGDKKYATEADRTLGFFFKNCQSRRTGLMTWGEHLGWDFRRERMFGIDKFHEFFRPWILWKRCWDIAPGACEKFAKGLWLHQIGNHKTGAFSRHARWSKHGPDTNHEYPRHGGFYIATWSQAYRKTQKPVYKKAVETLVDMFNRTSSKKTGAIPVKSDPRAAKYMWPLSNLSLAIDLADGASAFSKVLRDKMLRRAATTDKVFLAIKHDFSSNGIGFVGGADTDTLLVRPGVHTQLWATGYGRSTDAQTANLCYLRYCQLAAGPTKTGYKKLILDSANRYLQTTPDLSGTIYPGSMGSVILHMLGAYEITDDKKYLDRADFFAKIAVNSFLTDDSSLPRASSIHNHYEAITLGDTLMMALLKLWKTQNKPDLNLRLIYVDR